MILMHTTESTLSGSFSSYTPIFQYASLNHLSVCMQMFTMDKATPMETIAEGCIFCWVFCYLF